MTTTHPYATARDIVPSLARTAPDDDCLGLVGPLPADADRRAIERQLVAAGYQVSTSRDDAGVEWIWVQTAADTGYADTED